MKSKKTVWIAAVVLVVLLIAAAVLYHTLGKKAAKEENTVPFEEEFENAQEENTPETEQAQNTSETEQASVAEESWQSDLEDAADFTVETKDGTEVKLSDMAGKPVIVNFWATWCPPCQAELPHFQEMYKEYGDQIQFMMVDLMDGSRETQATLQAFLLAQGYTFPVYADRSGEAANAYRIYSIPMTICVTAEGKLLSERIGALSKEELQSMIDSLLKG